LWLLKSFGTALVTDHFLLVRFVAVWKVIHEGTEVVISTVVLRFLDLLFFNNFGQLIDCIFLSCRTIGVEFRLGEDHVFLNFCGELIGRRVGSDFNI
jgi:hypothetical protein